MLANPNLLIHTYFSLRHAYSIGNQNGIIISNVKNGKQSQYGLTDFGREQAEIAVTLLKMQNAELQKFIIYSSPFSRAIETAQIFADHLGIEVTNILEDLGERDFGQLEFENSTRYQEVWERDKLDVNSKYLDSESTAKVFERMYVVINTLENSITEKSSIILTSHGDPLLILETYFRGLAPNEQMKVPNIRNAEIRQLNQN